MLTNESRVSSLNGGTVVLTTHQLHVHHIDNSRASYASMTLDAVASCAVGSRSDQTILRAGLVLLIIAIIFGIFGNDLAIVIIIVSLILIAFAFVLSKTVLQIESTGGRVFMVPFGGDSEAVVTEFIKEINTTKLKYLLSTQTTTTDSA